MFTGLDTLGAAAPAAEPATAAGICASGETYALTLWHQWDGKYLDAITAAFDDYMAANPCVTIDLSKPEDVSAALNTAVPAGEGPDIIGWANDQIGTRPWPAIIVPLNELGIDQAFLESNYEPAAVAGMQYAWQASGACPKSQEGIALVYNKAIVTEEYLPTDPMDFAALLEKATAFKTATGNTLICNQAFTGTGGGDAYHSAPLFFGFGVPAYVDEAGNGLPGYPRSPGCWRVAAQPERGFLSENSYDICLAGLQGRQGWHVVDRPVGHRWP